MSDPSVGKTWPDVVAAVIEKLGVPTFLVISFVAGYYYIESDYKKIIERKDAEIQSLSNNLSTLNQKQLAIAKSAMDINANFVEATKSSFTEINSIREQWNKSKGTSDQRGKQIESLNAKINELERIKSESDNIKNQSLVASQTLEKVQADLSNEKQKVKQYEVAIQKLAAAVVEQDFQVESQDYAKTFLKANKEQSERTLVEFATNLNKNISLLNLIGLDKSSLVDIVAKDKSYEEWVEVGDNIYGVVSISKNEFKSVIRIKVVDGKVNGAEIIKHIGLVSGLVKEGDPAGRSRHMTSSDEYGLYSQELYNLKAQNEYSLSDLLEGKYSLKPRVLSQRASSTKKIEPISFTEFESRNKEYFEKRSTISLEPIIDLDVATKNMKAFDSTPIAAQLKNLPATLFSYLKGEATATGGDIDGVSKLQGKEIGWALIAKGSELLPIEVSKNEAGEELITLKILYAKRRYTKEIMTLIYNASAKSLKMG